MISNIITTDLLKYVLSEYKLDPHDIHGLNHWLRVRRFGLEVAKKSGANPDVVEYFAFFHDIRRARHYTYDNHGVMGADFLLASSIAQSFIKLQPDDFQDLVYAIRYHSDWVTEANPTIQTCWDADRLDLFRGGHKRETFLLCTEAAKEKEILDWAESISVNWREYPTDHIFNNIF